MNPENRSPNIENDSPTIEILLVIVCGQAEYRYNLLLNRGTRIARVLERMTRIVCFTLFRENKEVTCGLAAELQDRDVLTVRKGLVERNQLS